MDNNEEHELRRMNVEKCAEILEELVGDSGRSVHSLAWDSGAPGPGAGIEVIYEYRGMYWASPSDDPMHGPYDTFEEALDEPFVWITGATEAIKTKCPVRKLLPRLIVHADVGHKFTINGTVYEVGPERSLIRRPRKPKRRQIRH